MSVYNARKQKHTADSGDTHREGNRIKKKKCQFELKKFANIIHAWTSIYLCKIKRSKLEHLNWALLFLTYIFKVACPEETTFALMSLTICIFTRLHHSHHSNAQ